MINVIILRNNIYNIKLPCLIPKKELYWYGNNIIVVIVCKIFTIFSLRHFEQTKNSYEYLGHIIKLE